MPNPTNYSKSNPSASSYYPESDDLGILELESGDDFELESGDTLELRVVKNKAKNYTVV